MRKILISPSPHLHTDLSTRRLMTDVTVALLPVTLMAVIFYGWAEVMVLAVSILTCVLTEWLITRFLLKRPSTIGDMSAVVTGILLALNVPSILPLWVVAIGGVVAVGVAKMTFGGLGQNVFNPALVARVFLLISFPVFMTTWPVLDMHGSWLFGVDAVTGPTFLTAFKEGSSVDGGLLLQNGSVGEISDLALLAGFAYLLIRRTIKPWITLSIWGTVLLFSLIVYLAAPDTYMDPFTCLMSGGIMLGSIFMATDYVTSPMTNKGGVIFGVGIGLLTVIIRYWGAYPEGVSFAILIMNAFVPLINKLCKSKKFGR